VTVAGIILTNAFEVLSGGCFLVVSENCGTTKSYPICTQKLALDITLLQGLFYEPSLMNHDCVGNTRYTTEFYSRVLQKILTKSGKPKAFKT
jgi:hypothetical protein